MKNLAILTFLLCSTHLYANDQQQRSYGLEASVEGNFFKNPDTVGSSAFGKVEINTIKKEIYLAVSYFLPCRTDVCNSPLREATFTFPLEKEEINVCNQIIYTGSVDKRDEDQGFRKIVVQDNTLNVCPTFLPLADTSVRIERTYFNREAGTEFKHNGLLLGDQLERVILTHREASQ